ncbi:MAG: iron uptake porin [Microcoleaceae cyanobacterium]
MLQTVLRRSVSILGTFVFLLLGPTRAFADPQHPQLTSTVDPLEDVTPIHQLTEIWTEDWSFQALQALGGRYGCIQAFPNPLGGNVALNRAEFAVLLQACLEQLTQQPGLSQLVSQNDLTILRKLSTEFASELKPLQNRVNALDDQVSQLESEQFSTTTRLTGETLFQFGDSFGQSEGQPFLGYRVRLSFDTSFTGQDLLRTRIEARDIARLDDLTGTAMARLGTDGGDDDEATLELAYQFPIGDSTQVLVGPQGVGLNDIGEVLSPLSSGGRGAVSRFGRRDPATFRAPGGTGAGIRYQFSDQLRVNFGYFASGSDAQEADQGLFNSSYSILAQLVAEPTDELSIALTYTHAYHRSEDVNLMGATGTQGANQPFGNNATSSDRLGLQVNWEASSGVELGGWFGYTKATQQQNGDYEATILNGALILAFPDLLIDNSLAGIIVGIPPVVSDHDIEALVDQKTAWHLEALYRFQISDFIEITPGTFVIINPDLDDTDLIWVGTIRTQFSF